VPILFPFPNRIRNGEFDYLGQLFRLPKNDPAHANAIHGFAPRNAWRIVGSGADAHGAWLQADFQLSTQVPDAESLWPGDGMLSVVYRLERDRLRIEMSVRNMGDAGFPFGVGLHPYFRLPGDNDISQYTLEMPARSIWPLQDNLPIGERALVPDPLNWHRPRPIGNSQLDTVYSDLGAIRSGEGGLLLRAVLSQSEQRGCLEIWTTSDFREVVVFTPPHRNAVCVEPYTCVTNAANLQPSGVDAGWRELVPGQEWTGVVEFRWSMAE
jgi:aldose 1-epimerase